MQILRGILDKTYEIGGEAAEAEKSLVDAPSKPMKENKSPKLKCKKGVGKRKHRANNYRNLGKTQVPRNHLQLDISIKRANLLADKDDLQTKLPIKPASVKEPLESPVDQLGRLGMIGCRTLMRKV